MSEHRGTHADAPFHTFRDGLTNDEIPASRLVGPGVIIDVRSQAELNPNYMLSVNDIKNYERVNGRVPAGAIVMMNSGWGHRYPDPKRVFNTPDPADFPSYRFPGYDPQAVLFLARQRFITALGTDTPSIDIGQSVNFAAHVVMGENQIVGLENVANVGDVPPRGSIIVIGLIKLKDGTGGPSRVIAIVDNSCQKTTGGNRRKSNRNTRRKP
ncbi:isatin hydrolase-like [Littorina saxatilis]|uniref:Cyclase family protein n=1 Tax=Littorina saxatilis TaxID=31220 RepID=A0AAN9B3K6_9CAEN